MHKLSIFQYFSRSNLILNWMRFFVLKYYTNLTSKSDGVINHHQRVTLPYLASLPFGRVNKKKERW